VAARAWIGTSGWNYKHWREIIYPKGLSQRRWLDFYLQHFDTVEVNTSFYRIPTPATVQAWSDSTPPSFRFALKLWRGITHYRKLKAAADLTGRFLESTEVLPVGRRAPLLIQLPPNQGKDLAKLRDYILEFRDLSDSKWRIAVEFRNASWLEPDTYSELDRLDAALCIHDMAGKGAVERPNDASFVYARRHGSQGGRYEGSYSPEQIAADACDIARWKSEGRSVWVYYNNDIGGHAWWNATALRAAISSEQS
jgi:uncharacterized protein YecE (DUF72 family)